MAENPNEEAVEIVLRQTTLSRDEVVERLQQNNYNYVKVIEEFMGINRDKSKKKQDLTVNQQIYKEIRGVMDEAANYFKNNVNVSRQ
jgi:hypothetical protein